MVCHFSNIEIDWQTTEVRRDGAPVKLKPKAFQLLEFLYDNRDRVVSKDELFDAVWQGRIVSDGALTTAVNDLRRALGDTGKTHQIIRTFYGQGLRFIAKPEDHRLQTLTREADSEPASVSTPAKPTPDPNLKVNVGLAVLPFDNLSIDPQLDRLGEAIAEDLITALSKFAMLAVVSRTSSFAASRQSASLQDTAEALGVDYVIEGSIRPLDNQARLTVQLIDTSGDDHIWAGQFDWPADGTSQAQFEATSMIVGQLIDQITRYEMQLARNAPDQGLTAWHCYYRGINTKNTHELSKRGEAISYFERAVALNSDFALARALLSYMLTIPGLVDTADGLQPADPAQIKSDLVRAEDEAKRSLEVDDRYPYAWVALARNYNFQGRPKDGLRAIQNALDLNPLQPVVLFVMADCLWSDGRPEDAIVACDRCIVLGPSSVFYSLVLSIKSCALIALERYEEAVQCSRDAQARLKDSAYPFFGEICALGYLGRLEEAASAIQRAQRTIPGFNAALFEYLQPTADQRLRSVVNQGFQRAGLS